MLEEIGLFLSLWGVVFGLAGAWLTAQPEMRLRRYGFIAWLINGPALTLSLVGIAAGWWGGLGAWALAGLNVIYLYTAYVGYQMNSARVWRV